MTTQCVICDKSTRVSVSSSKMGLCDRLQLLQESGRRIKLSLLIASPVFMAWYPAAFALGILPGPNGTFLSTMPLLLQHG